MKLRRQLAAERGALLDDALGEAGAALLASGAVASKFSRGGVQFFTRFTPGEQADGDNPAPPCGSVYGAD